MKFLKYQHVERLGTVEVEGILDGPVYVFPKIDGANTSVWNDHGSICCGKRSQSLGGGDSFNGFKEYVESHVGIRAFLTDLPYLRLCGEWLVPHTLKTYRPDAWRKFYVFDVMTHREDGSCAYLDYEAYNRLLGQYSIEYIPCMATVENASDEIFDHLIDQNDYLMAEGIGEGIVIKRYDFVNKYGNTVWAKKVTSQFKRGHLTAMNKPTLKGGAVVEDAIVNEFVTLDLVNKVYNQICNDNCPFEFRHAVTDGWNSRYIHRLLGLTWHQLIAEEIWHILKKFKAHPVIDFKLLERLCIKRVKELKPELF